MRATRWAGAGAATQTWEEPRTGWRFSVQARRAKREQLMRRDSRLDRLPLQQVCYGVLHVLYVLFYVIPVNMAFGDNFQHLPMIQGVASSIRSAKVLHRLKIRFEKALLLG
jgi:hypothetical protein